MPPENLALRLVLKTGLWLAIMGALLFTAAGTLRWMQGWAFLAIFAIASVGFGAWLVGAIPACSPPGWAR